MAEEDPKVPSLSDMPQVGDLSLPGQKPPEKPPEKPEDLVKVLPEQLQAPTLEFMGKLAKSMIAQQTRVDGDTVSVEASPQQVEFYKQRFDEILGSGLLNPSVYPLKKIS